MSRQIKKTLGLSAVLHYYLRKMDVDHDHGASQWVTMHRLTQLSNVKIGPHFGYSDSRIMVG